MFSCCLRKDIFDGNLYSCLIQTKLDHNNSVDVSEMTLDDGKSSMTIIPSISVEGLFCALNNNIKALLF